MRYICGGGCRVATNNLEGNLTAYPKTLCNYYKIEAIYKLLMSISFEAEGAERNRNEISKRIKAKINQNNYSL